MPDNSPTEHADPAQVGRPSTVTNQSGGVNIDAQHDVAIGGDVVGGDKIVTNIYNAAPQQEPKKVPMELPPRAAHFTDRQVQLEQLLGALKPGEVVTLFGTGGIGKTALAAEALWKLTNARESPPQAFPDGVLFHSFYDQRDVTLALEHFAISYGEEPRPTAAIAAQRALAGRKALLVLDGAEMADNLEAALAVRGSCGVLVTSRNRADAVAEFQQVPPLEVDDAVELLRAWGGKWAENEQAVRRICEIVGGLPLAVRLAGRYLAERDEDAADYLIWLRDTPLEALDLGKRQIESVPILIKRSLAYVSAVAVEALAIAGRLALTPFDRPIVGEVLRITEGKVNRALGELVQYGLLVREGSGYRVSHALVHTYAQQLVAPEGTTEKLGNYFLHFSREQYDKRELGYEQMDAVRPHLMVVLQQLVAGRIWEPIVQIAQIVTRSTGEGYLQLRSYWNDEYYCLSQAAYACERLLEQAVETQRTYWSRHLADFKFALGDLLFYRDQYEQAAEVFKAGLALYTQIDDAQGKAAETNLRLGEICLNRSQFDEAADYLKTSLRMYERLGAGEDTLASVYALLGDTYRRQGLHENAESSYERSLAYYQNTGKAIDSAFVLVRLAAVAFDKGEETKAMNYLRRSEELANSAHGPARSLGRVRLELANHYRWRRNFKKAEELHLLSLQDFVALGDKHYIAWSLQGLGDTYFEAGDHKNAEKKFYDALKYFDELGILHGRGYALDHLGMIKLQQAKTAEARQQFTEALEIFKASGLKDGMGYVLFNLGDVERAEGKWKEAVDRYQESLQIWEELANTDRISLTKQRLEEVSRKVKDTNIEV